MSVHFDDIAQGQKFESAGRTITESDIVSFAGLSGDFNPLHTDERWVRANTEYNGRIAHGLLVLAVSSGLRTPELDDWAIQAFLSVERQMIAPVYPGDTLRATYVVESTRPSRSRPGSGVVIVAVQVLNQHGEPVQEGRDAYLIGGEVEVA